jgi:hypothetical protein
VFLRFFFQNLTSQVILASLFELPGQSQQRICRRGSEEENKELFRVSPKGLVGVWLVTYNIGQSN